MALSDYQRSFRGLVVGEGTDYDIIEEDGVESLEVRDGDVPFPRATGSIPGKHFAESKIIVLTLEVVGALNDNEASFEAFKEAFQLAEDDEAEYRFKNPGQDERFIRARVIKRPRKRDLPSELGVATMSVALKAADPRVYGGTELSALVPAFDVGGGGFDLGAELPLDMSAPVTSLAVATNSGDYKAHPLIRVHHDSGSAGTVTAFTLTNLTNGDVLNVTASILAGKTLNADMGAYVRGTGEQIIYIDSTSYYGDWEQPRTPFSLEPGDNVLKFEITGTATDVTCVVTYRDTYL